MIAAAALICAFHPYADALVCASPRWWSDHPAHEFFCDDTPWLNPARCDPSLCGVAYTDAEDRAGVEHYCPPPGLQPPRQCGTVPHH